MLAWATVAALLVLCAFALIRLAWVERPTPGHGTSDGEGSALPPVSSTYLRRVRIPSAVSGYDRAVVDALLERAADALEHAHRPGAGDEESPVDVSSGEVLEDGGSDGAGGLEG